MTGSSNNEMTRLQRSQNGLKKKAMPVLQGVNSHAIERLKSELVGRHGF